jgi:proteasome maturation protein
MIRNHQGIGAQLKYMMELDATSKVGRLPFLPSSNASRDALLGLDEMITPTDIYGTAEFSEKMLQPHAVMEKKLGIL